MPKPGSKVVPGILGLWLGHDCTYLYFCITLRPLWNVCTELNWTEYVFKFSLYQTGHVFTATILWLFISGFRFSQKIIYLKAFLFLIIWQTVPLINILTQDAFVVIFLLSLKMFYINLFQRDKHHWKIRCYFLCLPQFDPSMI